jgi:hypothetical protein
MGKRGSGGRRKMGKGQEQLLETVKEYGFPITDSTGNQAEIVIQEAIMRKEPEEGGINVVGYQSHRSIDELNRMINDFEKNHNPIRREEVKRSISIVAWIVRVVMTIILIMVSFALMSTPSDLDFFIGLGIWCGFVLYYGPKIFRQIKKTKKESETNESDQ